MGVVDQQKQWLLLGVRRQEAERGRTGCEAVLGARRRKREGTRERGGLRRRNAIDGAEHRTQQLRQSCEGHRCLGFDATRAEHPHTAATLLRIFEQRRLPDSRLPDERQHAAAPSACSGNEPIDGQTLLFTSQQHRLILARRCP